MIWILSHIILLFILISFNEAYWHVSSTIESENDVTNLKVDVDSGNQTLLQFNSFGKQFNLSLVPLNDIFSPQFQILNAKTLPNGKIEFEKLENISEPLKGSFYQISPTQGALYFDNTENSYELDGIIDDNTRLLQVNNKPNSYKLIKLSWKNTKQVDHDNDLVNITDHKVEKRSWYPKKNKAKIETLVILDDSLVKRLSDSKFNIRKYLGIYWNSVKRRYADIKNPEVDFVLTGAIKADTELITACTFKPGHLNGNKLLDDFSYWLYNNAQQLPKFDIAMLQTSLDLASYKKEEFSSSLLGRAYVGTVCKIDTFKKRTYKCGIGEDVAPVFSGVMTTAHEIAHILGVPHDGEDGAYDCHANEGYLMGHDRHDGKVFHFSYCSKRIMSQHLKTKADCVYDTPSSVSISLLKTLPGQVTTLDAVCVAWYGEHYKAYAKMGCNKLRCYNHQARTNKLYSYGAPPEGTSCGINKYCLNGECVLK